MGLRKTSADRLTKPSFSKGWRRHEAVIAALYQYANYKDVPELCLDYVVNMSIFNIKLFIFGRLHRRCTPTRIEL
jgi:hypothetical protein